MDGIVLGAAMMISTAGISPAPETSPPTIVPAAFTFDLPADVAMTSRTPPKRFLKDQSWRRESSAPAQTKITKRFSTTDRIIAVAAGVAVGWVVGGAIGYKLTQSSTWDDGTSGLKGVIIGAPIGGATGAILGWQLTR
jgi:hypothetical protein